MLNKNKIAVISSGNGGQSMAAYVAGLGFSAALYVREQERAAMFPASGQFKLRGIMDCSPVVDCISCDMAEVVRDAALIMVTTPAQYHPVIAREMANCLADGQIIILNPGRTFGTYVFMKTLRENGCGQDVAVAEAETFMFACRCTRVAEPYIYGMKKRVAVAAHNPEDTSRAVAAMSRPFPGGVLSAKSVFHTSFANLGMIFHPLPILLNITRIESKEKFLYYFQGITPLVANILERLDRERIAVARAFGVQTPSAYEWLAEHYGCQGDTLYERIQDNVAYAKIYAPVDIDTRYIYEDIMTGCVPVLFAGQAAGVETPITKSSILWASTIYATDFIQNGRNGKAIDFEQLLRDAQAQRPAWL